MADSESSLTHTEGLFRATWLTVNAGPSIVCRRRINLCGYVNWNVRSQPVGHIYLTVRAKIV